MTRTLCDRCGARIRGYGLTKLSVETPERTFTWDLCRQCVTELEEWKINGIRC